MKTCFGQSELAYRVRLFYTHRSESVICKFIFLDSLNDVIMRREKAFRMFFVLLGWSPIDTTENESIESGLEVL